MKENLKESKYNNSQNNLTTLKGYTTSQINQALKADNPYPARVFLKIDNQEQDIPVFFRINEEKLCPHHKKYFSDLGWKNCCPWYCHGNLGNWIRPKIKKGSYLQVQGNFSIGTIYAKNSERKSFTATSYQLLACPHSQKKPYFCPIDCPCLKGKEVLNQQTQQQILSHE